MAASKRANAIPSAFVARQSLNDEELVSLNTLMLFCLNNQQTYFGGSRRCLPCDNLSAGFENVQTVWLNNARIPSVNDPFRDDDKFSIVTPPRDGSIAEWLVCWTQAQ